MGSRAVGGGSTWITVLGSQGMILPVVQGYITVFGHVSEVPEIVLRLVRMFLDVAPPSMSPSWVAPREICGIAAGSIDHRPYITRSYSGPLGALYRARENVGFWSL